MKIRPEDFINASINGREDPPSGFAPNEFFEDMRLDPGLAIGIPAWELSRITTETALEGVLTQQQYLVYDMATSMGVLTPFVEPTQLALQSFDLFFDTFTDVAISQEIELTTMIGIAATALSVIPVYGQIAAALIGLGLTIASMFDGGGQRPRTFLPCQSWQEETNDEAFKNLRKYTKNRNDWTDIFRPRFKGELSLQICKHKDGLHGLVWGLGDGQVPHVRKEGNRFGFGSDGEFVSTGGIGMIPGGQKIYSLMQSTPLDYRTGKGKKGPNYLNAKGRKGIFEERCGGGDNDVMSIDVGQFYPTVAQAGVTLWDFMFQRGAAMYSVDVDRLGNEWIEFFQSIWGGVEYLWANPEFYGSSTDNSDVGYGRGFWEGALQQITRNYGVGMGGSIGAIGAWAPNGCRGPLQNEDRQTFLDNSVLSGIILPALSKLKHVQNWHLQHTTMAAYLPINGGKNANPLDQGNGNDGKIMGAFRSSEQLRAEFSDSRARILQGPLKYEVRLQDVLDETYRKQIEDAGGGIYGEGSITLTAGEKDKFPGVWVPTGGAGFDGNPGVVVPPGRMPIPPGRMPIPPRGSRHNDDNTVALILGGLALAGGSYWAWNNKDKLRSVGQQLKRRVGIR